MFKTQILADKLTHLTDARYFAARDVDIICFSIDENEDYQKSAMSINAMKEWITGPKIFIRPGFRSEDEILDLCSLIQPEAIIGNFLEEVMMPGALPCPFYLDLVLEDDNSIHFGIALVHKFYPTGVICDIRNAAYLEADFMIGFTKKLPLNCALYLKFSNTSANLETILEYNITGIAIDGSTEEKTGLKSFEEIDQMLDNLEV